jgi:hypothetical protein
MENQPLTTARAARLLGLALIVWALSDAIARQAYMLIQRHLIEAEFGVGNPLPRANSLFLVVPSLIPPIAAIVTGLLLILLSQRIQKLLR